MTTQNFSLEELEQLYLQLETSLDLATKQKLLKELEVKSTAPDFWTSESIARETMQTIAALQEIIEKTTSIKTKLVGLRELAQITHEAQDESLLSDYNQEVSQVAKQLQQLKIQSYLSGEYDNKPAILSVHSGQGGTEAMDWAAMLMRMYMRYFERSSFDYQLVEQTAGEEAGIKSATFMVKGDHAYGYLRAEAGTHRLVRLSPFNADNLRQTSFALVEVLPLLDKPVSQIKEEDLEWQFYRSGGAGGQNVNKVNTAARVKHIPSGIVVSASSQRTQLQNRQNALDILESKLEQIEKNKQEETSSQLKGDSTQTGWGHQIRSYVLHPYQMVKDLRTGVETSSTEAVLDGDIQEFIDAGVSLKQ